MCLWAEASKDSFTFLGMSMGGASYLVGTATAQQHSAHLRALLEDGRGRGVKGSTNKRQVSGAIFHRETRDNISDSHMPVANPHLRLAAPLWHHLDPPPPWPHTGPPSPSPPIRRCQVPPTFPPPIRLYQGPAPSAAAAAVVVCCCCC